MLSLSNASDQNEFKLFYERICKDLNKSKVSLSAEPKFDGLAISLTYRKGLFHSAVTRGDGVIGEDVSINVRTIKTLPLALNDPYSKLDVVLKAEIYMNISDFNMINSKLKKITKKFLLILATLLLELLDNLTRKSHQRGIYRFSFMEL